MELFHKHHDDLKENSGEDLLPHEHKEVDVKLFSHQNNKNKDKISLHEVWP